jgi:hypothetical protein
MGGIAVHRPPGRKKTQTSSTPGFGRSCCRCKSALARRTRQRSRTNRWVGESESGQEFLSRRKLGTIRERMGDGSASETEQTAPSLTARDSLRLGAMPRCRSRARLQAGLCLSLVNMRRKKMVLPGRSAAGGCIGLAATKSSQRRISNTTFRATERGGYRFQRVRSSASYCIDFRAISAVGSGIFCVLSRTHVHRCCGYHRAQNALHPGEPGDRGASHTGANFKRQRTGQFRRAKTAREARRLGLGRVLRQ